MAFIRKTEFAGSHIEVFGAELEPVFNHLPYFLKCLPKYTSRNLQIESGRIVEKMMVKASKMQQHAIQPDKMKCTELALAQMFDSFVKTNTEENIKVE